ncbi:MAG: hypothetical protein IKI58_11820 [Oscillospiraceae bacterium]|nr:hypothetical protein [Oscillospiraceae bacterium]
MQCNCCRNEIAEGLATCPHCGFPVLVNPATDEYRRMIEEHRARKLSQITIDLQIFSYEVSAEGVTDKGSAWRPLAGASQLRTDAVFWSDLSCQELVSDRNFSMRVRMRCGDSSREQVVPMKPDHPVSREHVGVIAGDDFSFRLAVGNKDSYILSEPVGML